MPVTMEMRHRWRPVLAQTLARRHHPPTPSSACLGADQAFPSVKGVLHQPEATPSLKQETRDAILLAAAKARSWIDDIASGCVRSFAEIAEREDKVERHIRLLTPLAFIPPRILAAIIDGMGPHDATVTALAQAVPYRWDRRPVGQASEQNMR